MRLFAAALLAALPAAAQQLELPRPSPAAKVSQTMGVTEITVDYSSPGVKGRAIYGGLVPFDKPWRTGANLSPKITFSKDVQIGAAKVAAGTYLLVAIPGRDAWTWIVNKNPGASPANDSYKPADDVVRVEARPAGIPPRERMAFIFSDTTDDSTRLDLDWDKTRVSLPIRAFTADQVAASIKGLEDGSWGPLNQAARYMLETTKDYESGMRLVEKSLALRQHWFNLWTKAQLLAAQGKHADARALAEKVQELGGKAKNFFAAEEVKKALADWKDRG